MSERTPHGPNKVYYANSRPDHYQPKQEVSALTPGEQARMEFFREIFEVGRRTYKEESRDASATQQRLGLRAVDVLNEVLEKPFNIPRHVQNIDAYSRQKLGLEGQRVPLRNRLLRIYGNVAVGSVATGIDWMDMRLTKTPADTKSPGLREKITFNRNRTNTESMFSFLVGKAKNFVYHAPQAAAAVGAAPSTGKDSNSVGLNKWAGAYGAGFEYILDQAVSAGADKLVQTLTKSRAGYASPLSHKLYNISRLIPVADEFLSPTAIEAVFRIGSNYPILGAPVEALYRYLNGELSQSTAASKFAEGLAYSMVRGQIDHEKAIGNQQRQAEYEERGRRAKERGERLESRLQDLEQEAQAQARDDMMLAEALVTDKIPEDLKTAVTATIKKR